MAKNRDGTHTPSKLLAHDLSISVGTVHYVLKLFEQTGEVKPKTPDRDGTRKLDNSKELFTVGLLMHNPSLYLGEICQKIDSTFGIQVTLSTVCRIIHRNGLTRKKIQQVDLQRSTEFRGNFLLRLNTMKQTN